MSDWARDGVYIGDGINAPVPRTIDAGPPTQETTTMALSFLSGAWNDRSTVECTDIAVWQSIYYHSNDETINGMCGPTIYASIILRLHPCVLAVTLDGEPYNTLGPRCDA